MARQLPAGKRDALFEAFCDTPTVEHVSRMCGVHHATVRKYRRLDEWDRRLGEVRREASRLADHDLAKAMAENLKLLLRYKDRFAQALEKKSLDPREVNASEFEKIVRLEAFVLGGVESRHEIHTEFHGWTDEELEAYAKHGIPPRK